MNEDAMVKNNLQNWTLTHAVCIHLLMSYKLSHTVFRRQMKRPLVHTLHTFLPFKTPHLNSQRKTFVGCNPSAFRSPSLHTFPHSLSNPPVNLYLLPPALCSLIREIGLSRPRWAASLIRGIAPTGSLHPGPSLAHSIFLPFLTLIHLLETWLHLSSPLWNARVSFFAISGSGPGLIDSGQHNKTLSFWGEMRAE